MKIRNLLPIIGIAIFVYILLKLDLRKTLIEIANANVYYLILASFLVFVSLIFQTFKWYIIALVQKINLPFGDAMSINLIGLFYGFLTPGKLGGAIRADYIKNYKNGDLGKGISNYVLDKILDTLSIVFIIIVFSFAFSGIISTGLVYYFLILFLFSTSVFILFLDMNRSKTILRVFYKTLAPERMKEKLRNSFYSFYRDMPKRGYFILFFLANILTWMIIYASTYFMGVAVGINASFFYYMEILSIGTLVSLIPISIGGLGTREATTISLFRLIGVEATKVFSMSLLAIFISSIIPSIIGIFLTFKYKGNR